MMQLLLSCAGEKHATQIHHKTVPRSTPTIELCCRTSTYVGERKPNGTTKGMTTSSYNDKETQVAHTAQPRRKESRYNVALTTRDF